jgi:uncharacterized Zn-finger protein
MTDFLHLSTDDIDHEDFPDEMFETYTQGKQKNFMCKLPDCGKIFRYKSEILRHITTHSEYRPYVCNIPGCNKGFKRRDALDNHIRTHTKEKPFICSHDGCDLKFPTKASLRYHLLKHEGQKTYKCTFPGCEKTFLTLSQLKQHENSASVHKNVKMSFAMEPYESVFYSEEPLIEKKLPQQYDDNFFSWESFNPKPESDEKNDNAPDLQRALKENDNLRKKLEESQKLITILQQRVQMDPFAYMDHINGNDLFGESKLQPLNTDSFFNLDE